MNERNFYLSRMFSPFHYSNISFPFLSQRNHTFLLQMQAIETYTPSLPNLHLTPFLSADTIADDVNPLNYPLTPDDFITLTLPNSQLLYALDPATGTSLWWALRRIAKIIMRAAVHSIPFDPSLPVAQRAYIPDFQFDHIAMQRPAILSTLSPDCMNPLYGYTSREIIQGWFIDFQDMGRQAVQWIHTARIQSAYFGLYLGWNWDVVSQDIAGLEFPNSYLIKGPDGMFHCLEISPQCLRRKQHTILIQFHILFPQAMTPPRPTHPATWAAQASCMMRISSWKEQNRVSI